MSPSANTTVAVWAKRLDWMQRIVAAVAIPMLAGGIAWARGVEQKLMENATAIELLKASNMRDAADLTRVLQQLQTLHQSQIEVLQRLSKIEAIVTERK